MIRYRTGNDLALDSTIALYERSTLGERRPIQDPKNVEAMLRNANLVVSAWDGPRLVGIARSFSDFVYITYLSDLAVDREYQRQGIGKELIRATQAASGPRTIVLLVAAPASVEYYPHIGFTQHNSAWLLPTGAAIK